MDQVGYAIIGSTGIIGRVHIDAINHLDNCRVVGINARTQEPLIQQASELGVPHYPTLEDALSSPDVDAIIIATPHPSHHDITVAAAAAGKHVLVEKPISVTMSEADAMVKATRDANVKLGVLFNQRFRPESLKARELIENGAVGNIYRASLVSGMMRTQDYYDRLGWRGTWEHEGGGALINQGIHGIDMFQWLGGMPESVYASARSLMHKIEVEDYASALLEYEGGPLGTLHCDTVQAPSSVRIEVWGDNGGIVLDDWKLTYHKLSMPVQEFINTDKTVQFITPDSTSETFEFDAPGSTHIPAIGDFADAILNDREPAITGEDGSRAQELVGALTLSACRKQRIELPMNRGAQNTLMEELKQARRLL